jgi:hypothetical protein
MILYQLISLITQKLVNYLNHIGCEICLELCLMWEPLEIYKFLCYFKKIFNMLNGTKHISIPYVILFPEDF